MRTVTVIIFFSIALACFFGGYQLAKYNPPLAPLVEQSTEPTPGATAIDPSMDAETTIEPADNAFALRESEPLQTLSDRKGRQVAGTILEIRADSLTLRRQADSQLVNIPISILADGDQAYITYLLNKNGPGKTTPIESTPTTPLMEDEVWDELFR